MAAQDFDEEGLDRALGFDRSEELDIEELPVAEFMRLASQPPSDDAIRATRELSDWFLRRYPTARERFAYIGRARARVPAGGARVGHPGLKSGAATSEK